MKKFRIVKINQSYGKPYYQVQRRHWLFGWIGAGFLFFPIGWYDDNFYDLKDAEQALNWFSGKIPRIEVIND